LDADHCDERRKYLLADLQEEQGKLLSFLDMML